ncbi:MAG: magnesium transporter [Acidobacteria bacterium]|nr:MAG: magnesium transporter [Acidobacteriota bacterium]
MIYFTELDHAPVFDAKGELLGHLSDMAVNPAREPLRVSAYLVKTPKKNMLHLSYEQVQSISIQQIQTSVPAESVEPYAPDEGLLHVRKDILDQQIIDVNNRKVVRVNDVDFDIQPTEGRTALRIIAVNVGIGGFVRRLFQGGMAKHTLRLLTGMFPTRAIPWEFVNLIEPDPARRVKLRISFDRLARLHPADLADIIEELGRHEQKAVIESLDDETAAQALNEVPDQLQTALLESIAPEKAADIVEEMPPDEAADVLQKLEPQTSAEVLADMGKEVASEVRELLGFEQNTAGALMNTEYIFVGENSEVEGAVAALKYFEGPLEAIHEIYLIDNETVLKGLVPVARILIAESHAPLADIATKSVIAVQAQADQAEVVNLFHKYNLLTLPVVDEESHLLGVVTADDVLDLVISGK